MQSIRKLAPCQLVLSGTVDLRCKSGEAGGPYLFFFVLGASFVPACPVHAANDEDKRVLKPNEQ